MNQRCKQIAAHGVIILVSLTIISCAKGTSKNTGKAAVDRAIGNALSWVYTHPAHFAEYSPEIPFSPFVEISEEIITFYILHRDAQEPSLKNSYTREIQKRLELIASKDDFTPQPPDFTMLLAIASISEKMGLHIIDFRTIIEQRLLSSPLLYPPHVTTSIWNTVYLERMGFNPRRGLDEIMSKSTLVREVQQRLLYQHVKGQFDPMYIDPVSITTYDITHEIFSLTDFGELPPPPIIIENQAFYAELFDSIIQWSITAKHIDILAEVIMCAKILHLKGVPSVNQGIQFIIDQQKKDGSFGVTNPGRPNVFRHGILVSIMALALP
ncbi:MAG: DUF6895 family protein [bacterium]